MWPMIIPEFIGLLNLGKLDLLLLLEAPLKPKGKNLNCARHAAQAAYALWILIDSVIFTV